MSNLVKMEDQRDFLQNLIDSKKLPGHVKTVEDAFTIAQMGKELGFATMQSFHYIIPIQGKLSLTAKAIGALLRKGGINFKTIHDSAYVYADGTISETKLADKTPVDIITTIEFYRGDVTEICSFTWDEATKMGITSKDNWKKMPKFMMYARCLSKGANRIGADHLLGLYCVEELYDHLDNVSAVRNEEGEIIEIESED